MRILVIFTGGTIGSTVQGEFIATDKNKKYKILESIPNDNGEVSFDVLEPYTILSENLKGDNITILTNSIRKNCFDYDGIIVTHGTDTIQYTAAGLSILLPELPIPVVLVSSNYVLEDENANGIKNFSAAVNYISYVFLRGEKTTSKTNEYNGIFVAYNNGEDETNIHIGSMLLPHSAYDDRIYSVDNMIFGYDIDGEFIPDTKYDGHTINARINKSKEIVNEEFKRLSRNTITDFSDGKSFEYSSYSQVLYIKEHPGNIYSMPSYKIKCVLLETYHSGTLCAENESLKKFIKECNEDEIPVFIVGMEDRTQYESTKFYDELKLAILPKISPVLAYMLLWLER